MIKKISSSVVFKANLSIRFMILEGESIERALLILTDDRGKEYVMGYKDIDGEVQHLHIQDYVNLEKIESDDEEE